MAKQLIDMTFINEPDEGSSGAFFRDFFTCRIADAAECETAEEADAMLRAAYKGPDVDGMGVRWFVTEWPASFNL
jgi:hypothetical protein